MLDRGEPHAGRRDEAGQPRRLRVGEALRGNRATYSQREVLLEVAVAAVEEVQAVRSSQNIHGPQIEGRGTTRNTALNIET